jgi:hypothetical protein
VDDTAPIQQSKLLPADQMGARRRLTDTLRSSQDEDA